MKIIYKSLCLFLIVTVIFCSFGCTSKNKNGNQILKKETQQEYSPVEKIKFNLSYISGDTFNPFNVTSEVNKNLCTLLYDSLFSVDNEFKAHCLIAESFSLNGKTLTVTLKKDISFSDGSPVKAEDVVFSFEKAKDSEIYKNQLSCFESSKAKNAYDVEFDISQQQRDIVNLLTFPIIKSVYENDESEESELTDQQIIGSGRYILAKDKNSNLYLTCNTERLGGYFPLYRNIGLNGVADSNTISNMYALGNSCTLIDTLSDGEYTQKLGSTSNIKLTNFVYIVCNRINSVLSEPAVKKAINYTINREEICSYSFINNGYPSSFPFHPDYYKTKNIKAGTASEEEVINMLEEAGYENVNDVYGFRYSSDYTNKILKFNLAVCKDNPFKVSAANKIKEQLSKISIAVNIVEYTEEEFKSVVASGGYDMYIGECKLNNNLDISCMFENGNELSSGINSFGDSAQAYEKYQNGEMEAQQFIELFNEDLPFFPLLFRSGIVSSNSIMAVSDSTIVSDYYYNIDKWKTADD